MNPLAIEEKDIIIEDDSLKFDAKKARLLVKFLLSEDKLYFKFLNSILFFNDEQLGNFFQGNEDYKEYPYHNIEDKIHFKFLLWKFKDYNCILFKWYKDESKYDNIIKLWKQNYCIYKLKDLSDEELKKKLEEAGISNIDKFMNDYRSIINYSIETKSSQIVDNLKNKYFLDFYSLTNSSPPENDKELLKEEKNSHYDIEEYIKQIKSFDLDNYEDTREKIINIGKKIYQMKLKVEDNLKEMNKCVDDNKSKEKKGIKNALEFGAGIILSAAGIALTGGLLAGVYGAAMIGSGIASGINTANCVKANKQLNNYKDLIEKQNELLKKINSALEELRLMYNKIQERYIPVDLLK